LKENLLRDEDDYASDDDSISISVTYQDQVADLNSDFTTMERCNSEFVFGSFGPESNLEKASVIPIKMIKPSIEG
jgi:hypothetical protein